MNVFLDVRPLQIFVHSLTDVKFSLQSRLQDIGLSQKIRITYDLIKQVSRINIIQNGKVTTVHS